MQNEEEIDFCIDKLMCRWAIGIYASQENVRFFRVRDRKSETILPLVQKYVQEERLIWTDERRVYRCLIAAGYTRQVVNHSKHYANPETKMHTQRVERS